MDNNFRILIVEDDMIIAADISMQLAKIGYEIIGMCTRAEDVFNLIKANVPDIILMDIHLNGQMDGIEASQIIFDEYKIPLIFLTSNSDDATFLRALETKPYGFIAKPFQRTELERALKITRQRIALDKGKEASAEDKKDLNHISTMEDRLYLKDNGQMLKVMIDDILFVEADRSYCKVITKERTFFLSIPLSTFEVNLPAEEFIRTHRSFLVNLKKIDIISEKVEYLNILTHQVPISRRLKEDVMTRLKLI